MVSRVATLARAWVNFFADPRSGERGYVESLPWLVDLVEDAAVDEAALRWAQALADNAPRALAGLKHGLTLASRGATPEARAGYEALRRVAFASAEAQEGRQALRERRRPRF